MNNQMTTHDYSPEQSMNVQQLAELTGKSPSTIRRHKTLLQQAGAHCGRPQWKVTKAQAQAARLLEPDTVTSHDQSSEQSTTNHEQSLEKELRARISTLESALTSERERIKHLEKLLDTEKQEKLLWLKGYLSEAQQLEQSPAQKITHEVPSNPRPSLWRKLFGR